MAAAETSSAQLTEQMIDKPTDCNCAGDFWNPTGHAFSCPVHARLRDIHAIQPLTDERLEHIKTAYCFLGRTTTTRSSIFLYATPAIVEVDSPERDHAAQIIIDRLIEIGFLKAYRPILQAESDEDWYEITR